MKPEKLFLVLFVCMGILLAMLYGAFELGGWEMRICEKRCFGAIIIAFAFIVAFVILIYICECFKCSGNSCIIYMPDIDVVELQGDVHSFYVLKDEKNGIVPQNTEAVIYCGSDILKENHFKDIHSLKCLSFAGSSHKIEKKLYKTLIENDVNITVQNKGILQVIGKGGDTVSSIGISQKTEAVNQSASTNISGQIDISVHEK